MKYLKITKGIVVGIFSFFCFTSCFDLAPGDACSDCQEAIAHYVSAVNRFGCDRKEIFDNAYQKMYNACGRKALDYQWMICTGEVPTACE